MIDDMTVRAMRARRSVRRSYYTAIEELVALA
jgi:hypothetical protein